MLCHTGLAFVACTQEASITLLYFSLNLSKILTINQVLSLDFLGIGIVSFSTSIFNSNLSLLFSKSKAFQMFLPMSTYLELIESFLVFCVFFLVKICIVK